MSHATDVESLQPDRVEPPGSVAIGVGNVLLDRQHLVLKMLARSLVRDLPTLGKEGLLGAARDILALAQRHCAAEEDCLLRNGYEWLEQHREEHRAGMHRMHAQCDAVDSGTLAADRFAAAIVRWLDEHFVDMDLPARAYLAAPAAAADPA